MAMKTGAKRTLAIAIAAGLALAPAATGVSFAQETAPAITAGTPDFDRTGTLTINKRIGVPTDLQGTGQSTDANALADYPAAEGVGFRIQQVNVDLSTNAGWREAADVTPATAAGNLIAGTARDGVTNANGQIAFEELPLGLYLVTETSLPENSPLVPGPPFLVYVPMTTEDGDAWNYDVQVFPKNTETEATKEVEDRDQNVGDEITYTIRGSIPAGLTAENAALSNSRIAIRDYLDAENAFIGEDNEIRVRGYNGSAEAEADVVNLEPGTHFTVDRGDFQEAPAPAGTRQVILVELTNAGLAAVAGLEFIAAEFDATVKAVTGTDGTAVNEATVITNDGSVEGDTETPTNEVTSYWAKVVIDKVDGRDNTTKLEGAVFQVYQVPAEQCNAAGTIDADDVNPLTVNGQTTWTTDANGAAVIDGLHVTDFVDGIEDTQTGYCLVETEAPDGYAALEVFEPLTLTRDDLEQNEGDRAAISYNAQIENFDDENFLPNTGGMGVLLLILVGAGVVGAGAYAARRNSAA